MIETNKDNLPHTKIENSISNKSYVYENWTKENFIELYSILKNSSTDDEIMHLFLEGYTEVFKFKENFIAWGYTDFTFRNYLNAILKFYGKNFQKLSELTSVFEKLVRASNNDIRFADIMAACSRESKFIFFLVEAEKNNPIVVKAGMNSLVNYFSTRFNSNFNKNGTHYVPLDMVNSALKSCLLNIQESTSYQVNADYGWNSIEEWSALFDSGKEQFHYQASKGFVDLRFVDFLHQLLELKSYARNKNAVSLVVEAKNDFKSFLDRTNANSEIFKTIEKTQEYKIVLQENISFQNSLNNKIEKVQTAK